MCVLDSITNHDPEYSDANAGSHNLSTVNVITLPAHILGLKNIVNSSGSTTINIHADKWHNDHYHFQNFPNGW